MPSSMTLPLLIVFAVGYLLGSIPFGLLLTRLAGLGDLRSIGSGNIGATNVLRTGNKGLAAATLVLDCLKGTAAVLAAVLLLPRVIALVPPGEARVTFINAMAWAAGLGAILGHMFPLWLGFRGGKGVATFIGALIAIYWPAAVLFALIWCAVAAALRYSSLSALIATVGIVAYFWIIAPGSMGAFSATLMAVLIFYKHRENIARLLSGTESRIGAKG